MGSSRAAGLARRLALAGAVAAGIAMAAPMVVAGPNATAAPRSTAPSTSAAPSTHTAPSTSATPSPDDEQLSKPGIPMPVREGALGYLATRSATLWLSDRGADDVIANLPVPPAYVRANRAMADNLERELASAKQEPGACLQIIVDASGESGGLFNYGFFAVEKQYCPK